MNNRLKRAGASITFAGVKVVTGASNALKLPIVSTGRPFSFYRRVFFEDRGESEVLDDLRGKRILDVGCGLTPYTADSMFQACYREDIEFYGVDPKLDGVFEFGAFDRAKVLFTKGQGLEPDAPGEERRLGIYADDLPFEDESVDLILSSWALFVWIADPQILNSVLAEAARVLKEGGEVRIYPTPNLEDIRATVDPAVLQAFELEQVFLAEVSVLNLPPAFRTTFKKLGN